MSARVAVLGTGANGASIAADLHRADVDVTLIEQWPAHVEAVRQDGLLVRWPDQDVHVQPHIIDLCQVAELREPFDVVLIVLKAYDVRWGAELLRGVLAADGLVAAVQNGMTTRDLADVVGAHRAVGTVIEVASTMVDPGVVVRHTPPERSWFAVGRHEAGGRGVEVAELLRHCGRVSVVDDIESTKWVKLVSNCTTLVTTALTGLSMIEAVEVAGLRDVMLASGQEALDVGRALGHPVLPIFGLQDDDLARPEDVVETLLTTLYRDFVLPGTSTTVLQDWGKGRRSEVHELNGEVVRRGRDVGVPTPVNAAIVNLARAVERGDHTPSPDLVPALAEVARRNAALRTSSTQSTGAQT